MMKKVFLSLVFIAAVLSIVVALQPDEFHVVRSTAIKADAAAVFAHVNNLKRWEAWSPWAKLDPDAKSSYAGPIEGTGAAMTWSGNNQIGEGTMTITESRPNELIRFRLDFVRPFASTSIAEFTFKPEGAGTQVVWSMQGKNNFIGKAIGLIIDCDKMVGEQFEKGLLQLGLITEGRVG
ncbi:MAG: SRPBCC family protein [Deltaproteobacteria bacterium]|nr:SRPBCC family protein [Deltaproteobacteria bacterium]